MAVTSLHVRGSLFHEFTASSVEPLVEALSRIVKDDPWASHGTSDPTILSQQFLQTIASDGWLFQPVTSLPDTRRGGFFDTLYVGIDIQPAVPGRDGEPGWVGYVLSPVEDIDWGLGRSFAERWSSLVDGT